MSSRAAGASSGRGDADQEREQALFGLMAVAEEQQAAVRDALAGLVAEREALAQERARLGQWAEAVRGEAAGLRRLAGEVGPGLAQSTREAVEEAVAGSLAAAGATAAAAVEVAAKPLLDGLSGVAARAGAVEASLRRVVGWATWRLLGRVLLLAAGLIGVLWLGQGSAWWWEQHAVAAARAERAQVKAEVAGLRVERDKLVANRDELVRAGLLAQLGRCGPTSRPCVRVNEAAGPFGEQADYRVLRGY